MNELPEEILERVLSFLDRSDRLESALTCRRWAQTVARTPRLLRDVWLVIEECRRKEAETVFANSQRQYEYLRFHGANSRNFNTAFWRNVGPTLRKMELIDCSEWSPEVFYSILEACSNLESLKLHRSYPSVTKSELPSGINLERIQKSMRNLRHLDVGPFVDADMLEHLLILMPNVSSIALTDFDQGSDFLSRLPNMLGTSRGITMLVIPYWSKDECEQLLRRIVSASLRTLIYIGDVLTPSSLDGLRNCPMLRDLDLQLRYIHGTHLLRDILRNVPELESLSICSVAVLEIESFGREDLMPIFDLRKLRKLHLDLRPVFSLDTYVPDEIVRDISRMISLEILTIGVELGIIDSTRFRILVSMPKLRKLGIERIQWDAKCLETILFDLKKLRSLRIHGYVTGTVSRDGNSERQGEREFSSLEVLEMYNIPLADSCLDRITAHHSRLKIITLQECQDITDAGLVTLFQNEPLLEKLDISGMEHLNGTFLETLGKRCRRLRSLRVSCRNVSSDAQQEFRLRRPRVKCDWQ